MLMTKISKDDKIETEKESQHVTLCISNSGLGAKKQRITTNQSSVLT
jgi:hypothetical protein